MTGPSFTRISTVKTCPKCRCPVLVEKAGVELKEFGAVAQNPTARRIAVSQLCKLS